MTPRATTGEPPRAQWLLDPAKADEFTKVMKVLRNIRLRDGAIQWGLYHDLSQPGRFIETTLVESWAES
ncbi:MFS transporter [Fischerella thermalis]|uniref:MFS transporter n=1 Tax=Fischerella thermalis TaxID=372787 RepID=UPI001F3A7760|nr:MFS transporter [Fischerella thermalis]